MIRRFGGFARKAFSRGRGIKKPVTTKSRRWNWGAKNKLPKKKPFLTFRRGVYMGAGAGGVAGIVVGDKLTKFKRDLFMSSNNLRMLGMGSAVAAAGYGAYKFRRFRRLRK